MPEFTYVARNLTGEKLTGKLTAGSEREALAQLGQQALFPLTVEAAKAPRGMPWGRRVSGQMLATFYSQLADLLRSGVPLLRALKVLERQTKHATLHEILTQIVAGIEEGQTLADVMARTPHIFDELSISVIRAGGEGGFLEEALEQIAGFTEKSEELRSRTIGAVAYPVFLMIVGILVVTGLMIFLVPNFAGLFARLREKGELPWLTEVLLATSDVMNTYGLYIAAVLVGLGIWARYSLATEQGRWWSDRVKIRLPLVGPIYLQLAVARFCRVLGTLLRNGVPILRSLEISSDSTGNRVLSQAIVQAAENISAGESLAQPLAACGHFPVSVVEMIAVAEESNSLEKVLVQVADGLDKRTWRQLELAVRLLEPLMLLLLAVAVLLIVLALLLPVIKMSLTL